MKTYFYIAFGLILSACHPSGGGFSTNAIQKADQVPQTSVLSKISAVLDMVRSAIMLLISYVLRYFRLRPENRQVDIGPYSVFYGYISWLIESGLQLWALLELGGIFLGEYGAKIMMVKEPIIVLFVFTIVASIVITTGPRFVKSLAWILPHLTWFIERALDYLKWMVEKIKNGCL